MMTMDVKGITWVGNIYQKFENMYLEAEEMICEDTVTYIENQMHTVGETVTKLYEGVMRDLLPPSSCDLDEKEAFEMPINQHAQGSKERTIKADTKQTTEDSRIDRDLDNEVVLAASSDADGSCKTDALFTSPSRNSVKGSNLISHSRQYVKSNLGIDENLQNKTNATTKTFGEMTLAETDTCRASQSCELSNQNHGGTVSKPASAEVTRLASVVDCCKEIENASTEQFLNVPLLVKSAEEREIKMSSSSSGFVFGETDGFSMDRTIKSDDCSMVILSNPGISDIKQGHKTMQQDDDLKLHETCVMVTGDELQLVPQTVGNLKTNKKKMRQAFSLSKKSARKQEYEELAVWHRNSEKGKGDCMENLDPTSPEDQKKLLLPNMSEPEWELL